MSSKIAFVFAGLHTLEEMTADYFQPFFASVIPLHVGFLNSAATRQILANPINSTNTGDVEAVINHEFFQRGRYYFEGVWRQAAQGAIGQHTIIKALAIHPEGLNLQDLMSLTKLDRTIVTNAIDTLIRHDVISVKDSCYRIIVELFRRWVIFTFKIGIGGATGAEKQRSRGEP